MENHIDCLKISKKFEKATPPVGETAVTFCKAKSTAKFLQNQKTNKNTHPQQLLLESAVTAQTAAKDCGKSHQLLNEITVTSYGNPPTAC